MGPNGSGKSTLAAVLAGKNIPDIPEGTITWFGRDLLAMAPEDRSREGILWFSIPHRNSRCKHG